MVDWVEDELRALDGLCDARTEYVAAFNRAAAPPPDLSAWEWADEHRILSKVASAESGRWSTDRVPYMREILECLSVRSPVQRVVFRKAAQVAATETGNSWLGYLMDIVGGPSLVVMPTVELAKRWSKQRLAPMLRDTPRLRDKVHPARERDSGNTILTKELADGSGMLVATGANSAAGLRSMTAAWILADEADGYPDNVDDEGHPIDIIEARQRTYTFRKIFIPSTPRVKWASRISDELEASDAALYHVPCEHCGGMQPYDVERLVYDDTVPEACHEMACVHCGAMMEYGRQTQRLAAGEWWRLIGDGAYGPRPVEGVVAGYQLSALYSPIGWASWGEIAERRERAKRDESIARTHINLDLGLPYEEQSEAPDWARIYERREPYALGTLPAGAYVLTGAADIQRRYIEIAWYGWGPGGEAWLIDHEVIEGDTSGDEVWAKLTSAASRRFGHAEGSQHFPADLFVVDQQYETEAVRRWAKIRREPRRIRTIVGVDSWGTAPILGRQESELRADGRRRKRGGSYWRIAVSTIKLELYRRLRREWPTDETPPFRGPWVHFPQMGQEWFEQLTAETLRRKRATTRSKSRLEWTKTRERNEALDLTVYNLAAAYMLGLENHSGQRWAALRRRWGDPSTATDIDAAPDDDDAPQDEPRPRRRVRRHDRRTIT